jgi:hypothetical protein
MRRTRKVLPRENRFTMPRAKTGIPVLHIPFLTFRILGFGHAADIR